MCLLEPFTGSKSTSPKNTCFQENMFSEHRKTPQKHPKNTKKHGFWKNMFLSLTLVPPHPPPPPPNTNTQICCAICDTQYAAMYKLQSIQHIYTSIYMLYEIKYRNRNKTKVQKVMRKENFLFIFFIIYYFFVFFLCLFFVFPAFCLFVSLFISVFCII